MHPAASTQETAAAGGRETRVSRGMIRIPAETVALMRAQLPAQTNDAISATFGISQNTWVKIRDGEPIRRSVGERLIARLARARK